MKLALTWDYEMYFGRETGSVENCMLLPTQRILDIANRYAVKNTFFTDVGYLSRSKELQVEKGNTDKIIEQIKHWDSLGHETGLHIHPHWEDTEFIQGQWKMDVTRYKLSDFSKVQANSIAKKYAQLLKNLVANEIKSFRAGGWCIQPFDFFKTALKSESIEIDSSVFFGGKNTQHPYQYDFTNSPFQDSWRFSKEAHMMDPQGEFVEYPIFSMYYSPIFFWKLFLLGRVNPKDHKPIGNGLPAEGGGTKYELLTRGKLLCVSMDGFFASKLECALQKAKKHNFEKLVFIGHPKACTNYSIKKLEEFVARNHKEVEFSCLKDLF